MPKEDPKIQEKENMYPVLAVSGSLLVIIALGLFVARPMINGITDLNNKIAQKNQEKVNLEEKIRMLKDIEGKYAEAKEKSGKLSQSLPNKDEVPEILAQVSDIAAKSGVVFESIAPSSKGALSTNKGLAQENTPQTTTSGVYQELPLRITLKTDSNVKFQSFLRELEQNQRIIDINAIQMNFTPGGGGTITLETKAYYQPQSAVSQ